MSKRPNLAAALHEAGARSAPKAAPRTAQSSVAAIVPQSPPAESETSGKRPPSREGQRAVTLYVKPEAHKQLRLLALDHGASIQDLMSEALNDLFRKHGRSQIV